MTAHSTDPQTPAQTPAVTKAAGIMVLVEALGLAALTGWQLVALTGGDTESAVSAIALVVLSAVGAIIVFVFGVGVLRARSWGRSGGIVTQVLIAAVALGASTGQYAHPATGLALGVPAVLTFVLLILAARRAGGATDRDDR